MIARVTSLGAGDSFRRYYGLTDTYATTSVSRTLITRSYGNPNKRSLWHRLGTTLTKLTSSVTYTLNYYFDNYLGAVAGSYSVTESNALANLHRTFWRGFKKNDSGRKANLVQIEITQTGADNGMTLKSIVLERTELNHRQARTKWVSD
jgi:hypothetical protein